MWRRRRRRQREESEKKNRRCRLQMDGSQHSRSAQVLPSQAQRKTRQDRSSEEDAVRSSRASVSFQSFIHSCVSALSNSEKICLAWMKLPFLILVENVATCCWFVRKTTLGITTHVFSRAEIDAILIWARFAQNYPYFLTFVYRASLMTHFASNYVR